MKASIKFINEAIISGMLDSFLKSGHPIIITYFHVFVTNLILKPLDVFYFGYIFKGGLGYRPPFFYRKVTAADGLT